MEVKRYAVGKRERRKGERTKELLNDEQQILVCGLMALAMGEEIAM
jgi:hypothetical protein